MASLNKIILLGRVENEPDLKATQAGDPVAKFNLIVKRPPRGESGIEQEDIIPIVAWQSHAQFAQECQQGDTLLIDGRILTRNYDNADGVRVYVTEVEARDIKRISNSDITSSQFRPTASTVSQQASAPTSTPEPVPSPAPQVEPKEPVFETIEKQVGTTFDFSDGASSDADAKPTQFDKPLEEDIPF